MSSAPGAATFREAYLGARRRIEAGAPPDEVVPALLEVAEAQEEIDMAEALYGEGEEERPWR